MHDCKIVAHVINDPKVMRNKHITDAQIFLNLLHIVQNLSLNRQIQRGNGFIGNNQLRVGSNCSRNTDALSLTAGKLVRKLVHCFFLQTDDVKQLCNASLDLVFGEIFEISDWLSDDVQNLFSGIQT